MQEANLKWFQFDGQWYANDVGEEDDFALGEFTIVVSKDNPTALYTLVEGDAPKEADPRMSMQWLDKVKKRWLVGYWKPIFASPRAGEAGIEECKAAAAN